MANGPSKILVSQNFSRIAGVPQSRFLAVVCISQELVKAYPQKLVKWLKGESRSHSQPAITHDANLTNNLSVVICETYAGEVLSEKKPLPYI